MREGDINQHHSNTHIFHFIVLINGTKFLLKFPSLDLSTTEFMRIIKTVRNEKNERVRK